MSKTDSQINHNQIVNFSWSLGNITIYFVSISAKLHETQKALSQVKMEMGKLTEKALPGLVQELGELQATSILKGDYELKIARQDYFTSKQDQVGTFHLYLYIVPSKVQFL